MARVRASDRIRVFTTWALLFFWSFMRGTVLRDVENVVTRLLMCKNDFSNINYLIQLVKNIELTYAMFLLQVSLFSV